MTLEEAPTILTAWTRTSIFLVQQIKQSQDWTQNTATMQKIANGAIPARLSATALVVLAR
jgi:hypothetical protein